MNDALKKPEKYRKKYMRSHTMIALLLDNERDSDIIEWLGKQRNRSQAIRELIRKETLRNDCEGCRYDDKASTEYPCTICKHNNPNMFEWRNKNG